MTALTRHERCALSYIHDRRAVAVRAQPARHARAVRVCVRDAHARERSTSRPSFNQRARAAHARRRARSRLTLARARASAGASPLSPSATSTKRLHQADGPAGAGGRDRRADQLPTIFRARARACCGRACAMQRVRRRDATERSEAEQSESARGGEERAMRGRAACRYGGIVFCFC